MKNLITSGIGQLDSTALVLSAEYQQPGVGAVQSHVVAMAQPQTCVSIQVGAEGRSQRYVGSISSSSDKYLSLNSKLRKPTK
ncbi:hypothetical protein [Ralstonia pseudosolanacearum]|uniref:hypothetical protein n=1 Tax=Ralstonia pseudosolanacearum TaxID=1310165 RepID=UPI001160336D|nr:hypothetical protein [Ralstonia pseudosolanacearum]QVX39879.1 hypothetical protein J4H89_06750 [Ralstonia solanacearum]QWF61224.1 hypothetical protein KM864_00945 [Ralstonia solanacearum]